jgi:NodT family efflux transporter outer membrane factor (OMF) lipoprotein
MSNQNLRVALLTIATLFTLNGCTMLGPNFQTPTAKTPSGWSEEDNEIFQKPSAEETIGWWSAFNDPTLDNLIDLFSKQNLTVQSAAVRIIEARAQLALVQGFLYPQSQQMTGDIFTLGTSSTPATVDRYYNTASIGFDVGWEMDFWGKYRRSIESADANLLSTIADYEDILVSLTAEVARTYVNIRTLEERIDLAEKNAELQENSLELVKLQFEAGVVTELDVLQAQTLLSTTRAAIPALKAALASAETGLAVLLGLLPEEIRPLLEPDGAIPDISTQIAVQLPAELLRRRPDVRRSEMQAAAQSAQIGIARAELYPSFTLFGSIGWGANDIGENSLGDIFDTNGFSYSFGPAFKWNLFNYGRLKNEVRIQDARFQQTLLNYQNTVLNAAREVEDAMRNLTHARTEAEYLRTGVKSSQRSTDLSMLQYQEGLIDYQRVLDSIRALTTRQDQYAQTQGKIATNIISLYKAFGGGCVIDYDSDLLIPEEMAQEMEERTDWGNYLHPVEENNE